MAKERDERLTKMSERERRMEVGLSEPLAGTSASTSPGAAPHSSRTCSHVSVGMSYPFASRAGKTPDLASASLETVASSGSLRTVRRSHGQLSPSGTFGRTCGHAVKESGTPRAGDG